VVENLSPQGNKLEAYYIFDQVFSALFLDGSAAFSNIELEEL